MVQFLQYDNLKDLEFELKKINVSSQGITYMAKKGISFPIKITNVKLGAANILKQEMLSIGADCAVARGIVEGSIQLSDVILLGNYVDYEKLISKLDFQPIFGLKEIQADLQKLLKTRLSLNKKLRLPNKEINFYQTNVMGILNVTPDSFSDGNDFFEARDAVSQARKLIEDGADIIDIGGESTRPGSDAVSEAEELERVIPVIKAIREFSDIPISIDTTKANVARKAIVAGADIVNDVSALRFDDKMVKVLQDNPHVPIILMHMQGKPKNMQEAPQYEDTIMEIMNFFQDRINFCRQNNIALERVILDPGIGFGKRFEDNLLIIKKIHEFKSLGRPILLGASRKRFINEIYKSKPKERVFGTLATTAIAHKENIEIIRVHDVKANVQFLATLNNIERANVFFTS